MANIKQWTPIDTGLFRSARFKWEILQASPNSYKLIITGNRPGLEKYKSIRYYKTNPQHINFYMTFRTI